MKKLLNKLRRKPQAQTSQRITSDTIAEHREKILAGGRRFKYPLQYARHRLVFTAIIIGVAAVVLLATTVWWQLYLVQNTSDLVYRITKVIPVPVARVDGQPVAYSDYLMKYRSSIHYLEEKEQVNFDTEDGRRQSDFIKRQEMDDAVADAYAAKLSKEYNVTVSDAELESYLKLQRASFDGGVSEATYATVISDYYGWSEDEYRHAMMQKLLRQQVAYEVDDVATSTAERVSSLIKGGETDLKLIASKINSRSDVTQVTYGVTESVPSSNDDGGLASTAASLKKGDISDLIKSTNGTGYYFIKVTEIDDQLVSYQYVNIPLTVFQQMLDEVNSTDKVTLYITIPETNIEE